MQSPNAAATHSCTEVSYASFRFNGFDPQVRDAGRLESDAVLLLKPQTLSPKLKPLCSALQP